MDNQQLAKLKELAQKATPGEWITGAHRYEPAWVVLPPTDATGGFCIAQCRVSVNGCNNAAYIAAANPQTILELLAKIERLEKENADFRSDSAFLEDSSAMTISYFAGRMSEGREKNKEIDKLLDENRRLEKEADWLAEQLLCCTDDNRVDTCSYECHDLCANITLEQWRQAARKAVENNQ